MMKLSNTSSIGWEGTMRIYEITLMLDTPVCLSSRPALGNETQTLSFVPGSALRGAVAAMFLRYQPADERFHTVFGQGGLRFSNLTPIRTRVVPRSAYTCKRFPGFRGDAPLPDGTYPHGVFDLLFEPLVGTNRRCPKCSAPLEPLEAEFYDPSKSETVRVRTETRTRTAVAGKGSAREGLLFTQEELAAGNWFGGWVSGNEVAFDTLLKALQVKPGQEFVVFFGKRLGGKARMYFGQTVPAEKPVLFSWSGKTGLWITMTLVTEAILVDRLLRPVASLGAEEMVNLLGFPREMLIEVVCAFLSQRRVAGWSTVGRMFKPDDQALLAGSTFLLHCPQGETPQLHSWLEDVTAFGIGLRREEGFGQVTFADPLHVSVASEQKVREL